MAGRRRVAALAAVVLAAGLSAACGEPDWMADCRVTSDKVIECPAGQRPDAPEIAGELLDGSRYDPGPYQGQVMVINFWGSWCAPCRAEADDLEETHQATRDAGVRFLGINVQDGRDKAIAFEQGRVSYPSLFDPASRLALNFEVSPNAIPSTVIVDRAGRIAVVIRRAIRAEMLTPIVTRIAAESPAPPTSSAPTPPAPASPTSPASASPAPSSSTSPPPDGSR